MIDKDYVAKIEHVIKQMLNPLKDIPFNLVIESLSGKKVVPFDFKDANDIELLGILKEVAVLSGEKINEKGVVSRRANEVGNKIEPIVKSAMQKHELNPSTPTGTTGKKKSTGYPDVLFFFENKPYYLECKTYNFKNISTTQRSFYFSPSKNFKVIYDTHHFMLSYEMFVDGRRGGKNIYKCKHYKILSLDTLSLDIKYEFNSNNKRVYSGKNGAIILDEGEIN